MVRCNRWLVLAAAWCLLPVGSARAYVDLAPTLARIVRESQTITLAEVERFSVDKGAVILKKVRDLKGQTGAEPIKHHLVRSQESAMERPILEWAELRLWTSPQTSSAGAREPFRETGGRRT